jgi:hypothetical protein
MLDGEMLGLIALGYRKVFYAELYCSTHDAIRIALELAYEERHPCPVCARSSRCSPAMRVGYTRHALPFWETIVNGKLLSGLIPPVPKRRQQMRRKATYAARFESQGFSFPNWQVRKRKSPTTLIPVGLPAFKIRLVLAALRLCSFGQRSFENPLLWVVFKCAKASPRTEIVGDAVVLSLCWRFGLVHFHAANWVSFHRNSLFRLILILLQPSRLLRDHPFCPSVHTTRKPCGGQVLHVGHA